METKLDTIQERLNTKAMERLLIDYKNNPLRFITTFTLTELAQAIRDAISIDGSREKECLDTITGHIGNAYGYTKTFKEITITKFLSKYVKEENDRFMNKIEKATL